MGYKQTTPHRYGKGSYHQIGLVRGQFGNVPMDQWVAFVQETGFDGWEEAGWELDLDRCGNDAGAEAYARERVQLAQKHGLEIFTVAAHLQGQALGDEPSAKTLQFVGGEPVAAYKAWRDKGSKPPRTNPYYVPDDLAALDGPGCADAVGFTLAGAHMEWQGVSVVQSSREFGDRIHCAHIKGVQVMREHTRAGLLGGHRPMGHRLNGWNFVTAGTQRDANSVEEIMIELNRTGYDGAVNIEWEDNDAEQHGGAKAALANVRRADLPPSGMRHDEMLKA